MVFLVLPTKLFFKELQICLVASCKLIKCDTVHIRSHLVHDLVECYVPFFRSDEDGFAASCSFSPLPRLEQCELFLVEALVLVNVGLGEASVEILDGLSFTLTR